MTLDQLVAAAAPADAVTNQAFAWQRVLAAHGIDGQIYAEHVHPQLADRVLPLARFRPDAGAACLLRYSIWSAVLERARAVEPRRLGLLYHNITPGRLLRAEQPALADLCDRGRRELADFAGRTRVTVADSRFNAAELEGAGFTDVRVVPLLLDLPAERPTREGEPAPVVVSVGRVVPSKRLEEGLRAFALLRRRLPAVRMELVGNWDGFDRYRAALGRFATALGVEDAVTFHGRVSDAQRDAIYERAGVYLCTSAHEGFCAPLVEAMSRGLAVVAHDAGAVSETLDGGGLVIPRADAALTAEALEAVLTRADVRRLIAGGARRRLHDLRPAAVEPLILDALAPLLEEAT